MERNLEDLSSFYISEFPVHMKANDLFDLFGCNGIVVKVAISPKRNMFGKRFGFARFTKVENPRLLAVVLDSIQILGIKSMLIYLYLRGITNLRGRIVRRR